MATKLISTGVEFPDSSVQTGAVDPAFVRQDNKQRAYVATASFNQSEFNNFISTNLSDFTAYIEDPLFTVLAVGNPLRKEMNLIADNQTAMDAIVASQLAMDAIVASQLAMDAIAASQTAMDVIAASQLAIDAIAASQPAVDAIENQTLARNTIFNGPNPFKTVTVDSFGFSGTGYRTDPFSGTSPSISDNQSTDARVRAEFAGRFHYNITVSSEEGFDFAFVRKNGSEIEKISGETSRSGSFSVNPGDEIRFEYTKDGSVSKGNDNITVNSCFWDND